MFPFPTFPLTVPFLGLGCEAWKYWLLRQQFPYNHICSLYFAETAFPSLRNLHNQKCCVLFLPLLTIWNTRIFFDTLFPSWWHGAFYYLASPKAEKKSMWYLTSTVQFGNFKVGEVVHGRGSPSLSVWFYHPKLEILSSMLQAYFWLSLSPVAKTVSQLGCSL